MGSRRQQAPMISNHTVLRFNAEKIWDFFCTQALNDDCESNNAKREHLCTAWPLNSVEASANKEPLSQLNSHGAIQLRKQLTDPKIELKLEAITPRGRIKITTPKINQSRYQKWSS